MRNKIKNKLETELARYCRCLDKNYRLKQISPLLSAKIKDFILRPGKRIRPTLFVLGYLAYRGRETAGLYTSALSIELLHDFMLVHDDIIDKSALRRGKPSMHAMFDSHFRGFRGLKFTGADLAIVAGDILYALAMDAFLAIKEKPARKEKALKKFIAAAFYTGCGEFTELALGAKPLERISQQEIYTIYDLKTAYYTFAFPLAIGATLAGASEREAKKIFDYGVYLGRAFQLLDDILGMFAEEKDIGKSALSDLAESKKTLLAWYAFNHLAPGQKKELRLIFARKKVTTRDLAAVRILLMSSGALDYSRKQIQQLQEKAARVHKTLAMNREYKQELSRLSQAILA